MYHQRDRGEEPSNFKRMGSRFLAFASSKRYQLGVQQFAAGIVSLQLLNESHSGGTGLVRLWSRSQRLVIRIIDPSSFFQKP